MPYLGRDRLAASDVGLTCHSIAVAIKVRGIAWAAAQQRRNAGGAGLGAVAVEDGLTLGLILLDWAHLRARRAARRLGGGRRGQCHERQGGQAHSNLLRSTHRTNSQCRLNGRQSSNLAIWS